MNIATRSCPFGAHREVMHRDGWWGPYETWRVPLHHGPITSRAREVLRRAPARCCPKDVSRWKRRRFVQKLRGSW